MKEGNGGLQGEWQLFLKGTPYEWKTTGNDVIEVLMNGVSLVVDMMRLVNLVF